MKTNVKRFALLTLIIASLFTVWQFTDTSHALSASYGYSDNVSFLNYYANNPALTRYTRTGNTANNPFSAYTTYGSPVSTVQPYAFTSTDARFNIQGVTYNGNLSLSDEPNPGNVTDAEVLLSDSSLVINSDYFSVISNTNKRQIWVNTMAVSKFTEQTPDGNTISLGVYTSSFYFRIPPGSPLPSFDINQTQNGEGCDFDIILYDGKDLFGRGSHRRVEAAGTWKLNPWDQNHNKIVMRTTDGKWIDKGLYIPYDREWHKITFVADFDKEILISVSVDNLTKFYNTPLYVRDAPE
jgi:hypothetical protein